MMRAMATFWSSRSALASAAWCSLAILFYAFVLQRVSFNAPIWDDYDTILASVMAMRDAATPREWLVILTAQHNEHRIAVMRLAALAAATSGTIDFRALMMA